MPTRPTGGGQCLRDRVGAMSPGPGGGNVSGTGRGQCLRDRAGAMSPGPGGGNVSGSGRGPGRILTYSAPLLIPSFGVTPLGMITMPR